MNLKRILKASLSKRKRVSQVQGNYGRVNYLAAGLLIFRGFSGSMNKMMANTKAEI